MLLTDLCARLPYNVTCQFTWAYYNETTDEEEVIAKENDGIRNIDIHIKEIQADYYGEWVDLENCKPYLRPMSSMTVEEIRYKLSKFFKIINTNIEEVGYIPTLNSDSAIEYINWLNANHFDYRGLIEKGLALEAPEGMYK